MGTMTEERPAQPASEYLKTAEAARYLSVCRMTLLKWAKAYRIKVLKRGNVLRWPRKELDRLVQLMTRVAR